MELESSGTETPETFQQPLNCGETGLPAVEARYYKNLRNELVKTVNSNDGRLRKPGRGAETPIRVKPKQNRTNKRTFMC